ncbi:hypothetical protein E3P99_01065 [Wallemia hederae]|uniref:Major facilitator superfamily (MFS) profile domain-containing protein n=1 Tax=Wallemia hederae TaxID=1540922 RepID=A0A4T0FUK5_9BASI|nr:hypothetical protein E3P99_01065 [Wallemia hederae]
MSQISTSISKSQLSEEDKHEVQFSRTSTLVGSACNDVLHRSSEKHKLVEADEDEDPMKWNKAKKLKVVIAVVGFSILTSGATPAFSIGLSQMTEDLDTTTELSTVAEAIFVCAFALPPMVLAGLSEQYGRSKIYCVSYLLYVLLHLPIAFCTGITGVILGRLCQGLAASVGSTLTAGSIADMYDGYERGIYLSLFAASNPFAAGVAPICYSYVPEMYRLGMPGQHHGAGGWRWIQLIEMAAAGAWGVVMACWVKETRLNVILQNKAQRLRLQTGDLSIKAPSELCRVSKRQMFRGSALLPLKLLCTESAVLAFSLFIGYAYAIYYALQGSIEHVFSTLYEAEYDMSNARVAFVFATLCVGTTIGWVFNYCFQERWFYTRFRHKHSVEARLGSSMVAGVVFSAGSFVYAFTTYEFVHWTVPCLAIVVIMAGIFPIYYSSMNYISDCYGANASSALAALALVRNLVGGVVMLVIRKWLDGMGFQWCLLMVAVMGTFLSIIPIALFVYGGRLRSRSRYCLEEQEDDIKKVSMKTSHV